MFSLSNSLNQKPAARLGSVRAMGLLAGAALGSAALEGTALAVPPPSYQLTIDAATVSFPMGTIPASVARGATGSLQSGNQVAHYQGLLGPISSSSYVTSAPAGINFRMEGDITGAVAAGDPISMLWEVAIEFTGGSVSWGLSGNAFAPGAGTQFFSQNGSFLTPSSQTVLVQANRTFGGGGTGSAGFYAMEFAVNWSGFVAGQTLKVTVNRMDIGTSTSVPSPSAIAPAMLAGVFGFSRRRRR
jgi:hypothetical protein